MNLKTFISGLLITGITGLSALTASATIIKAQVRVACPNDRTAYGIGVSIEGSITGQTITDGLGIAYFHLPATGRYTVCVDESTLPPGAKLNPSCKNIRVVDENTVYVDFELTGEFCDTPPRPGQCWMTGGGTVGKNKTPAYSFGGVVYPGCSPRAAEGGNWNVIDHVNGLHFQGQSIVVESCSGDPTSSPKVNVRIIDFHGTGILSGVGGNPQETVPVTFVGRAIDNREGGAGSDQLYLKVTLGAATVLQIGDSAAAPATLSTGNIQIHTSSCDN